MSASTRTQDPQLHPRIKDGTYTEAHRTDPGELDLTGGRYDWLEDAELLRVTRQAARSASAKWYGTVDVDDIQSETVLALMDRRRKMENANAEASDDAPLAVDPGSSEEYLARAISRSVATRLYLQVKSTDNYKGYRAYKDAVSAFHAEHGRSPRSAEEDTIANGIRLTFPLHHRPVIGFHRSQANRTVSLDGYEGANLDSYGAVTGDATARSRHAIVQEDVHGNGSTGYDVGSYGDLAMTAYESNPRDLEVKANAYCALAETRDAPMPVRNSITEADATKCRKLINAAGGIKQVAVRARAGELTKAETAAFLMPFPGLHPDRAEEVAAVMLSHPAYTEDLWGSTLKFSTRRAPRKRLEK